MSRHYLRAFWTERQEFLPPKDLNPLELWETVLFALGMVQGRLSLQTARDVALGFSVVPRLVTCHLLIPSFSRYV